MCGIVGTTEKGWASAEMLKRVRHRGPDDMRRALYGDFELGFARLAITGQEQTADIIHRDGDWLLFNGELFGYPKEQYKTDTEYLFHVLQQHQLLWEDLNVQGVRYLPELHGQYAFAYWNNKKQLLTLCRDFFGERPLYFYQNENTKHIYFSSESKALLPFLEVAAVEYSDIDFLETQVFDVAGMPALKGGLPLSSMVPGIATVPANHCVVFKKTDNGFSFRGAFEQLKKWNNPQTTANVGDLLYNAIVERSDHGNHEIGAYLSGGLDSALICCIARPKHVFTCAFNTSIGKREYAFAAKVAKRIGAVHHVVKPEITREAVARTVYYTDGPLATQSPIADFALAAEASKYVKAVLTGQGADELFCGYFRDLLFYEDMLFRSKYARYQPLMDYYHGGVANIEMNLGERVMWASAFLHLIKRGGDVIPPWALCAAYGLAKNAISVLQFVTQMEIAFTLPSLVQMNDRAAGCAGIEARAPFLDDEVYQGALGLPDEQKIHFDGKNFITKRAIRDIARGIVPDDIIDCEEKVGLHVPLQGLFPVATDRRGDYSRAGYAQFCQDTWRTIVENKGALHV